MVEKKLVGWGKNAVREFEGNSYSEFADIVENSAKLSVEEGQEQEATIEGGEVEARMKRPDKYILEFERRIGNPDDLTTTGYTEEVDSVEIWPLIKDALGVRLIKPSRHISISHDSKDGLKAKYVYKTKGDPIDDVEVEESDPSTINQTVVHAPKVTAAPPTLNGNATFTDTLSVTITAPVGAKVYYTTDGSEPTVNSTLYSSAISVSATTTIKALIIEGNYKSRVATKTFTKVAGE